MTTAPTPADVERLARKMCELLGMDPCYEIDGSFPRYAWETFSTSARTYLLAHAAHRALMEEFRG